MLAVVLAALLARAPVPLAAPGESGLPIPRFVSLGSDEANMRTGPGVRYPVAWVYHKAGLPMMVTAEYGHWRKVRDVDGTEGWMHKALLSGRRTAEVVDGVHALRAEAREDAAVLLRAGTGVIGRLLACAGAWCRLAIADHEGWLPRTALFGALPGEDFEN